jgi:hypothetical protein
MFVELGTDQDQYSKRSNWSSGCRECKDSICRSITWAVTEIWPRRRIVRGEICNRGSMWAITRDLNSCLPEATYHEIESSPISIRCRRPSRRPSILWLPAEPEQRPDGDGLLGLFVHPSCGSAGKSGRRPFGRALRPSILWLPAEPEQRADGLLGRAILQL